MTLTQIKYIMALDEVLRLLQEKGDVETKREALKAEFYLVEITRSLKTT